MNPIFIISTLLLLISCHAQETSKEKVLIIASNQLFHGDSKMAVGNSFGEIVGAYKPFIIETELINRGANFKNSKILITHMEVDGRLVTGQNSLSTKMVAEKAIEIHKNQNK